MTLSKTRESLKMRFFIAAVVALGIMTIDFRANDTNQESIFTAAAAQAEHKFQFAEQSINTEDAVDGLETDVLTVVSEAVPQATEPVQELPKNDFCSALKEAAESSNIPIGFFARLLWQESRFRSSEVSSAGAQGVAQFMPGTAAEVGLDDPFDPFKALPASAKFLRKLHDEFGNLGLAAAAYNAGGGRIEKWLSRRSPLPKKTRAYVKIITGHKAEAWTDEESTVYMPTDLPQKAPCEGVGGLSRQDQIAAVNVDLTPSTSAMLRKAEADEAEDRKNAVTKKLRVAANSAAGRGGVASRKTNARTALLASKGPARKAGKQAVRIAAASSTVGRAKSKAAREL